MNVLYVFKGFKRVTISFFCQDRVAETMNLLSPGVGAMNHILLDIYFLQYCSIAINISIRMNNKTTLGQCQSLVRHSQMSLMDCDVGSVL